MKRDAVLTLRKTGFTRHSAPPVPASAAPRDVEDADSELEKGHGNTGDLQATGPDSFLELSDPVLPAIHETAEDRDSTVKP